MSSSAGPAPTNKLNFLGLSEVEADPPVLIPKNKDKRHFSASSHFSSKFPGSGSDGALFALRKWMRYCQQNHDGIQRDSESKRTPICQPFNVPGQGMPLLLIDVRRCCLVWYELGLDYMALSYVWGQGDVTGTRTDRANFESLQIPGSLLGPSSVVNVPATVKDAVVLTDWLGVRYLWCDRFCIIQDDYTSKGNQINQMAQIFARACCTIIAYDSVDSSSGLQGIPGLPGSKGNPLPRLPLQKAKSVWSSRGWTYQEGIFSTRKIEISRDEIRWRCSSAAWTWENYALSNNTSCWKPYAGKNYTLDNDSFLGLGQVNTGGLRHPLFPSFKFYDFLIFPYTSRAFSNEADVDAAFQGTATALESTYPGGFIQGLPRVHFDRCLLWCSADSTFQRRYVSPSDPGAFRPASWSWMGWKGKISWIGPPDCAFPLSSPEDSSSVNWSFSTEVDSERALVAGHDALQDFMRWSAISESDQVPEGWHRNKDKTGQVTYTHPNFQHAEGRATGYMRKAARPIAFSFPFPVGKGHGDRLGPPVASSDVGFSSSPAPSMFTPLLTPTSTTSTEIIPNFLHARVPRATFVFSPVTLTKREQSTGETCAIARMIMSRRGGHPVGFIAYSSSCENAEDGEVAAVVAISQGSFIVPSTLIRHGNFNKYDELLFAHQSQADDPEEHILAIENMTIDDKTYLPGDRYEYFNVLWIQPGRPAYRRGAGRICKSAFLNDQIDVADVSLA